MDDKLSPEEQENLLRPAIAPRTLTPENFKIFTIERLDNGYIIEIHNGFSKKLIARTANEICSIVKSVVKDV